MLNKAVRRMHILEVAQKLFARFGLAKTTIEDIAKMAHMGKASIYYYFKNKEAIFQEVIDREGQILKKEIIKAVNKENTPQNKLRTYIFTRMLKIKELANYYRALRDDYLKHYSFIEKARQNYDTFEVTLISNILQEGVEKGVFDVDDTTLTAETIVAAMKGMEFHWTGTISKEKMIHDIELLLKILFKGIERRNSQE